MLFLVFLQFVPLAARIVAVACHLVVVQKGPTIILGIDPGTTIMGYGVVKAWSRNKVELLEMGALHLAKVKDPAVKLRRIHDRCAGLIEAHAPDHFAVEAPFFGKNVQSMLKLGRAQGVALGRPWGVLPSIGNAGKARKA